MELVFVIVAVTDFAMRTKSAVSAPNVSVLIEFFSSPAASLPFSSFSKALTPAKPSAPAFDFDHLVFDELDLDTLNGRQLAALCHGEAV